MIKIEILQKAIEKWGDLAQIDKIQEEAQELALALHQFKCPTKNPIKEMNNIYSELADMKIMMQYAELLFNPDRINLVVKQKMDRLEKLINTSK